jgi:hypothetical protein
MKRYFAAHGSITCCPTRVRLPGSSAKPRSRGSRFPPLQQELATAWIRHEKYLPGQGQLPTVKVGTARVRTLIVATVSDFEYLHKALDRVSLRFVRERDDLAVECRLDGGMQVDSRVQASEFG